MNLAKLIAQRAANRAALKKLIETASGQKEGWTDEQRAERERLKASIQDDSESIAALEDEERETAAAQAAADAQEEANSKIVNKIIDAPNPETAAKKQPHITTKELDESGGFTSFGEFISVAVASSRPGHMDERLVKLNKAAGDTRLLQDGAFMIPRPQATSILETAWNVGQITGRIPNTPITVGNSLHYLEFDDKDLSAGKVAAGVQVVWLDEGEDLSETAFKMNEKELNLKELGAYVIATENMLEDAPAFETTTRRMIDKAIAYELDKKALYGPGLGSMAGMLHNNNKARILVAKETQTPKFVVENFNKMYAAFNEENLDGAVWVFQPKAKEVLPYLTNAAGTAVNVYSGPMLGYDGKQLRPTLLGVPIIFHPAAKALGSEGDCALIAPSEYTMISKGGLKADMSIHVQFLKGKVVLRFRMRINGKPSWSCPLKVENGGHQMSPYVVLAGGR